MTQTNLDKLPALTLTDTLDVKDFSSMKNLDTIANNTKSEILTKTLESPDVTIFNTEMEAQLSALESGNEWQTEVPTTDAEKQKQSEILNFLGIGSSIAIAKTTQEKFSKKESVDAKLDISQLKNKNISDNITRNIELLENLKNIKNPQNGSAAYIVQTNWHKYSNAIRRYTLEILKKQKKQKPAEKDFKWTDNHTGTSAAAAMFIATRNQNPAINIASTLAAGLIAKTVQNYTETGDIQKTANHVFNDTGKVLKDGTKFIGDFLTNKNTSTSDKVVNGLGSLALGAGAWWLGKKALNWGVSLFTSKAKDVKNKIKEKIPEDSFFGKHWGKLSAIALAAFGLSKLPNGFWGNLLTSAGNDAVYTGKKIVKDTATTIFNKATEEAAENIHSQTVEDRDVQFTEIDISTLKNNLDILSENDNKSLAEQAKKILEDIKYETNKISLIDDEKALSIKDFKILATRARQAGYDVYSEKVEKNNTHTLYIGEMEFRGMTQDVIQQNDAIDKTIEEVNKFREENKATVMIRGMERLITILNNKDETSAVDTTTIELAQKIKKAVTKNGSKGFSTELYTKLQTQLNKSGEYKIEKEGAALVFITNNDKKYTIGCPPTVSNEAFDKYGDEINKGIFTVMGNAIASQSNDIANTTMEQLLNNWVSDDTYDENDPVYKLLQEHKADLDKNGDAKFVTPEFIISLGKAIGERHKDKADDYDALQIVVEGSKAFIVLQGAVLWSTGEKLFVNTLWDSWGKDENGDYYVNEEALAKGASPLLVIGGVKTADMLVKMGNPGIIRTGFRYIITKPVAGLFVDMPWWILKKTWKIEKKGYTALKGERARKVYKSVKLKMKNPATAIIDKLSNPEKIQAKILATTEKLLAEKVQIEGNPKKTKRIAKINKQLETLNKRWEGTQKKLKKIHEKKLKAERKILQQEYEKLETLIIEKNESLDLSKGDSKITEQKKIIQTQEEKVEKIQDRRFSTLTEEHDILLRKSETIDTPKLKWKILPTTYKTRIAAINDELARLVEIEEASTTTAEKEKIQKQRMELVAEKNELKKWYHPIEREKFKNTIQKKEEKLKEEKLKKEIRQKTPTFEERITADEKKLFMPKINKIDRRIQQYNAHAEGLNIEKKLLIIQRKNIDNIDNELNNITKELNNLVSESDNIIHEEIEKIRKSNIRKKRKLEKIKILQEQHADRLRKYYQIFKEREIDVTTIDSKSHTNMLSRFAIDDEIKELEKPIPPKSKKSFLNTDLTPPPNSPAHKISESFQQGKQSVSKKISTIIEKIPAVKQAAAVKLAQQALKTVGIAGTFYALSLIEDAENPYSAVTKEAAISGLFMAGILTGRKLGGVWGAVGGGATIAIATLIWGEDANLHIDKYFTKLETKVDKKDMSKLYQNGKTIISAATDLVFGSSLYDMTLGNIFIGDDAFEYFSDTNTQIKNYKLSKFLHRNEKNLTYWNKEQREEIQDVQEEIAKHEKIFNSLPPHIKQQIQNEFMGLSKNELLEKKKMLNEEESLYLSKIHYLQKELLSAKIENIQKKIITEDSPWVKIQTALFIGTFEKLEKLENKNSVEYFTLLKKFIIQFKTYANIGLINNIMENIYNNYPGDERKGIDLANKMFGFYTSILDREEELPIEIIEFLK